MHGDMFVPARVVPLAQYQDVRSRHWQYLTFLITMGISYLTQQIAYMGVYSQGTLIG